MSLNGDRGLLAPSMTTATLLAAALGVLPGESAWAQSAEDVPVGGYQPQVLFTLTDEFAGDTADLFFIAENDTTYNASDALTAPGVTSPHFEVGLFDTGAQINLLQRQAYDDFGILSNGFAGTEEIAIGGVAGTEFATVEDPLGLFATGFQNLTSADEAPTITVDQPTLVGQTSVSVATSPSTSALPNVVGLPMASQYTTIIRNSQPQIFTDPDGNTVRSPSVEFDALGTGASQGIVRRVGMTLDVSAAVGTDQPTYIFNIESALSGGSLTDNPSVPTAVAGGFFLDMDLALDGNEETASVFFDSGAQISVVSETFAAQLGFDAVLDTPDFTVPILGAGGSLSEVPGFYADTMSLNTVGGAFELTNVPLVILDVPNPTGTGAIDGILGTNVLSDRDIVIDPAGEKLWISDTVLETHDWATSSGNWNAPGSWDAAGAPDILWRTNVIGRAGEDNYAYLLEGDTSTVHNVYLAGNAAGGTMTLHMDDSSSLTTFSDFRIGERGRLEIFLGSVLDTTQLEVNGGEMVGDGTIRGAVENRGVIKSWGFDIQGTYLQGEQGTLAFNDSGFLDSPPNITISQTATLGGALDLDFTSVYLTAADESHDLLIAQGGVSGTFDQVLNAIDGNTMWSLVYAADTVSIEALLTGDFNNDGFVSQADLDLVLLNWGDTVTAGVVGLGDASGDGVVAQADLDLVLLNWGDGVAPDLSAIPEPATAGVLVTAGMMLLRRKRWY